MKFTEQVLKVSDVQPGDYIERFTSGPHTGGPEYWYSHWAKVTECEKDEYSSINIICSDHSVNLNKNDLIKIQTRGESNE